MGFDEGGYIVKVLLYFFAGLALHCVSAEETP
jgi:hypothetical protein